jgi:phospholipase/carboxylesterase
MVPIERGEQARDRLSELGYRVSWKTYSMAHAVCREEIEDIGRWLGDVLNGSTKTKPNSGRARMGE